MKLLDRYIARQCIINVLVLMALLGSFVVMVDLSLNLDKFSAAAGRMVRADDPSAAGVGAVLRRAMITVFLVADLWWPRLLQLYNFVAPLVVMGGMGFTFAQLVRHREVVAMLAGGVSMYRAARPVVLVALLFAGLQVMNQELVLPRIAPLLTRSASGAGERQVDAFSVSLVADGRRNLLQAARFDPATRTLERVNLWERDEGGRAVRRVSADRAVYDGSGWVLTNGRALPLAVGAAGGAGGAGVGGEGATTTGGAAGVAAGTVNGARRVGTSVSRLETDIDPTTLLANQFAAFSQTLSWSQIRRGLQTPGLKAEVRDRLERTAWGRVSSLVCGLLSLVIAMRFYLTREPVNMVVQSLRCSAVALPGLLIGIIGTAAVIPGLPPAAGVFLPVLVLLPLAIEAATAIKT